MPATPNPGSTPQPGPSGPGPTPVTIIGTFYGLNPEADNTVSFKRNQDLFLPGVGVVPPVNITAVIDGSGDLKMRDGSAVTLYATDDIGAQPYGEVYYRAIFRFQGAATEIRYFTLSHLLGTFDLSDLSLSSITPPEPPSVPSSVHTMTWPQAAALSWSDTDALGWQAA
jgi:hypothetical protein